MLDLGAKNSSQMWVKGSQGGQGLINTGFLPNQLSIKRY